MQLWRGRGSLWVRPAPLLAGAIILALVGVLAYVGWQAWQQRRPQADRFVFEQEKPSAGVVDLDLDALEAWGTWTDKGEKITYRFLENHEFQYRSLEGVTPLTVEGVWETGQDICWLGEEGGGNTGNLMVYVGSKRCCLQARWLGTSLVLTKVWPTLTPPPPPEARKGGRGPFGPTDFCSNRVLTRAKPLSGQEQQKK